MRSVYFAARYSRQEELKGYRAELEALGIEVTSRWLEMEPRRRSAYSDEDWRELGQADQADVLAADSLVCFTEADGEGGNGGRHVGAGHGPRVGPQGHRSRATGARLPLPAGGRTCRELA